MARPATPRGMPLGLGSFPFARRYLGNRCFFLFLRVLRCFSSPGLPSMPYGFRHGYHPIKDGGFPHSEISGSTLTYSSPKHIGVRPVLHRLLVPRHPPCALTYLTLSEDSATADFFVGFVFFAARKLAAAKSLLLNPQLAGCRYLVFKVHL